MAGISHDLRTLLTGIKRYVEGLIKLEKAFNKEYDLALFNL